MIILILIGLKAKLNNSNLKNKMIIGPSTGYLYMNGVLSVKNHNKILKEARANCFEINLGPNLLERIRFLQAPEEFGDFNYRALHLDYDSNLALEEQLALIKDLVNRYKINTAVVHPDVVTEEYYQKAVLHKIPLATENMDKAKTKGFLLSELEKIITTYQLGFVLDVQHAYEHDHEMRYAKDLFDLTLNSLTHLHVSGETEKNVHSLVHRAKNASKIIDFTSQILSKINVPIILEGEYKNSEELKKEIDFLKKELIN